MTERPGRGATDARGRLAKGALVGACGLGAAYWTLMSPYSQALGAFPYCATEPTMRSRRTVALSFDDGPNEPYTSQIAMFLAERDIRATFFQVGDCIQRHPGVTRALVEAGHVIGNHSQSHDFTRCWTRPAIEAEVESSQEVFRDHLGAQPVLYRPPWLARTPALFDVLRERFLQPVSGEFCHALEVFQPSAQRLARRTLAKIRPGAVIIFHDGYDAKGGDRGQTVAAVKMVVNRLTEQGYGFETVDRMLGVPAYSD